MNLLCVQKCELIPWLVDSSVKRAQRVATMMKPPHVNMINIMIINDMTSRGLDGCMRHTGVNG